MQPDNRRAITCRQSSLLLESMLSLHGKVEELFPEGQNKQLVRMQRDGMRCKCLLHSPLPLHIARWAQLVQRIIVYMI